MLHIQEHIIQGLIISSKYRLSYRDFIKYKFFNSLFLGVSIGSIFTIYLPLEPSIYSIGGVVLALSMLMVAKIYKKILNINWFYAISMMVEVVLLFMVLWFLVFSYSYVTALVVYIGYQATFIFGAYLIRIETIVLQKGKLLTFVDTAKQKGYLVGMFLSYIFYKILENYFDIKENQIKVYDIHFLLLVVEFLILYYLVRSFKRQRCYKFIWL